MRTIFAAAVVMMLAAGCDRIPGTEAHRIAKGETVAAAALIDPSSAQFRNTFLRPGPKGEDAKADGPRWVVCGEINGKNRQGAYTGFSRFLADPDGTDAYLEPQVMSTEADRDRALGQCERGSRGPIYSETDRDLRLIQCEQAQDMAREHLAAAEFDMTYQAVCGPDAEAAVDGPAAPASPAT